MKKLRLKVITGLLILAGAVSGCGSSGSKAMYTTDSAAYESAYDTAYGAAEYNYAVANTAATADAADYMDAEAMDPSYNADSAKTQDTSVENGDTSNRKLIKTVDMYVETENYDALLGNLSKQVKELGGYIEYQYEYNGKIYSEYNDNRNANWEIRIPAAHLDEFVNSVGEETNVIDKTERITDVTLQYVDLESHKSALRTEQKRLLELLEKAENVEDIITIEQRLSEVRYELENMESQLRLLDNKIDYSTVNLNIQEVKRVVRVEENSVWDRIRNGFRQTIYNLSDNSVDLFVWLIVNLPYLIIWAVVIIIAIVILRKIRKKRLAKKFGQMNQPPKEETVSLGEPMQHDEDEKSGGNE